MALAGGAESILFSDSLVGPQVQDGWHWLHENADGWRIGQDCIELDTRSSGIGCQASADLPPPSFLARSIEQGANACEVTVTMPAPPGTLDEQAGLFWYLNDTNYAKLVIGRTQDGCSAIILAREQHGEYVVHASAPLDDEEAVEPTRLRLEMSADGSQLSGCVVGSYYTRLIGSCPASSGSWSNNAASDISLSFGISAHGGSEHGRKARVSKFSAISVKSNRVQWRDPAATVPQDLTSFAQTFPQDLTSFAPPQQGDGYNPPAPGGWTMSAQLTDEQRTQIADLLALNQMPPLDEQPQQE